MNIEMQIRLVVLPIIFLFVMPSRAASPRTPHPFYWASKNGSNFVLKIIPESEKATASIECLRLEYSGESKQIWKIPNEYSLPGHIFMTYDGRYLARVCPPSTSLPVQKIGDWVFLEFFRDGKKTASVKIKSLNLDLSKIDLNPSTFEYIILRSTDNTESIELIDGDSPFFEELSRSEYRKQFENESGLLLVSFRIGRINLFRLSDGVKIIDLDVKEFNSTFKNRK